MTKTFQGNSKARPQSRTSPKQGFRRMLIESLENRQLMAADLYQSEYQALLSDYDVGHFSDARFLTYGKGQTTLKGGVSKDEIIGKNPDVELGKKIGDAISVASDLAVLASSFMKKDGSPVFDPDKAVNPATSMEHEVLYGSNKADRFTINHPHSTVIAGPGNDSVQVNSSYATILLNQGEDVVRFSSDAGVGIGGPGKQTYRLSATSINTVIMDSSPINHIEYEGHIGELTFANTKRGLEIRKVGQVLAEIRNPDFYSQELILRTKDATIALSTVLNIPGHDAVTIAIASYSENSAKYLPAVEKLGYTPLDHTVNDITGLEMWVHKRNYIPKLSGDVNADPVRVKDQYVVGIAGTQDARDFGVFAALPSLQYEQIKAETENLIATNPVSVITLVGHSGGGEVALRAGRDLAIEHPTIQFNLVMVNSGGVDPRFVHSYELDNLAIAHYRHEKDWLSSDVINDVRGLGHGKLVYPKQTETITIKTAPDKPLPLDKYHDAENVLEKLPPGKFKLSRTSPSSSTQNSIVKTDASHTFVFSQLPDATQELLLKATEQLMEIDANLPATPFLKTKFDFGSKTHQQPDTINISPEAIYSQEVGFGLKQGTQIQLGDSAIGNDWQRDYVSGPSIPFLVDLEPGIYYITLMTGTSKSLDHLHVYANSRSIGSIPHTSPREIKETTFRFNHLGGTLELELRDTGGLTSNAILNGLTIERVAPWAPVPTAVAPDPSFTIITPGYIEPVTVLDKISDSVKPVAELIKSVVLLVTPAAPLSALQILKSAKTIAKSSKKLYDTWKSGKSDVPEWVYLMQIASNHQNAMMGLPLQPIASSAISLNSLESMTNEEQQKLLRSTEVMIIDAQKQLNDGVKPYSAFGDKVTDANAYRKSIDRLSAQMYRAIANKGRAIDLENGGFKLDVQMIAEDFAVVAAGEAIDRIARERKALSEKLGYVELVALNPISVKKTDKSSIPEPETTPFNLVLRSFNEEVTDVPSDFYKGPLDGIVGGNQLGVEAGTAREFSTTDPIGSTRYKNFSKDGKPVSGEMERIAFHNHGLFAYANTSGYVSVVNTNRDALLFQNRLSTVKPLDLQFSPDGRKLAVLDQNGKLTVINLESRSSKELVLKQGFSAGLKWADDRRLLVAGTGSSVQSIPVAATGSFGTPVSLGRIAEDLLDFWVTPLNNDSPIRIVSIQRNRAVQIWSVDAERSPVLLNTWTLGPNLRVLDVDTTRGHVLVTNGTSASLMQIVGNELIAKLTITDMASGTQITAGRLSADGTRMVIGGTDQQLRVYSVPSALEGTRELVSNYSSIMPAVRAIELSDDAERVFVAYKDTAGGNSIDVDISEGVRDKLGLIGRFFGKEHDQAKSLPYVLVEKYSDQLRFHRRRDREDLDALYGQLAKQTSWKFAQSHPVDEILKDEDFFTPSDENNKPPTFQHSIPNSTIGETQTIDLKDLAIDPEGKPIAFRVRSNNPSIAKARIVGNQLVIQPTDQGDAVITLTASDGKYWSAINFTITTDPTLQRDRFEKMQKELVGIEKEQAELKKSNAIVDSSINSFGKSLAKINTEIESYNKRSTRLSKTLNDASAEVRSTRKSIGSTTENRQETLEAILEFSQAVRSADQAAKKALSEFEDARDVSESRQRVANVAKKRFEDASASHRESRLAEWRAARESLEAALTIEKSKRQEWINANDSLKQARESLNDAQGRLESIDARLRRLNTALRESLDDEAKARVSLQQHVLSRDELMKARDKVVDRLSQAQERAIANAMTAKRLADLMGSLVANYKKLHATRWVDHLGITNWESKELNPTRKSIEPILQNSKSNASFFQQTIERLKSSLR